MGLGHKYHVEPVPRRLMADFVAGHHYAVRVRRWPQRGCGARVGWRTPRPVLGTAWLA